MGAYLENILQEVNKMDTASYYGKVTGVQGLFIEVSGILTKLSIGDRCCVLNNNAQKVPCEVVSFKDDKILLMPYASMDGIGLGCLVEVEDACPVIYPHPSWLGRIINAFGEAIDGKGPLIKGSKPYFIKNSPPPAQFRDRVKGKVDLGVKAVNTFLTICKGQRMGIFAGSGVGKSTLMSMMARHTSSDVSVIGLIGERGREAKEFVEDVLGSDGLAKSVLVLATSDESPLLRRQAAYVTMAVAEFFRDENKDVLCMMDSITRFAMAQREIALSVGEPPASKGYT
ncbi:MAG: flagellum-specific ATP synthase FliI, partial [Alphaproteobacteria bacterium]|nr:flagellum-specific ATP synthase FliI [Alphaproteobacteria bacterium]